MLDNLAKFGGVRSKTFEKFTWDGIIKITIKIYENLKEKYEL